MNTEWKICHKTFSSCIQKISNKVSTDRRIVSKHWVYKIEFPFGFWHIWRKDEFCSILKNVSRHLFHEFWLLFFRKATNVCKPQGSINSSSKSLILISNLFNSNDFKFKRMCDVCEFGRITTNSNHYPRSPLKLIAFIGRKVIQSINGWRHFFVFRTNIHDTINKQMRCSRFNFINYNYIFSA